MLSACGGMHHSVCLMSSGRVFAFGRADYGQLGIARPTGKKGEEAGAFESTPGPVVVDAWGSGKSTQEVARAGKEKIVSLASGGSHNLGTPPTPVTPPLTPAPHVTPPATHPVSASTHATPMLMRRTAHFRVTRSSSIHPPHLYTSCSPQSLSRSHIHTYTRTHTPSLSTRTRTSWRHSTHCGRAAVFMGVRRHARARARSRRGPAHPAQGED